MSRRTAFGLLSFALVVITSATTSEASTGVFTLAAGDVATLTHSELIGCDATEWGDELGSHPWQILGAKRQTCPKAGPFGGELIPHPQADLALGPFRTTRSLRLFLIDEYPTPFTFFSDDRKHTTITQTGTATWRIAESDSNFGRYSPFDPDAPRAGRGNLRTTLRILAPNPG